jgi:phage-related protein
MAAAPPLKPVEWIGSSLGDLRRCPEPVQDVVGYALHLAQLGDQPPNAKRLKGELAGILEIVDDFDRRTYRAVYTVKSWASFTCCTCFRRRPRTASRPRGGRSS